MTTISIIGMLAILFVIVGGFIYFLLKAIRKESASEDASQNMKDKVVDP